MVDCVPLPVEGGAALLHGAPPLLLLHVLQVPGDWVASEHGVAPAKQKFQ